MGSHGTYLWGPLQNFGGWVLPPIEAEALQAVMLWLVLEGLTFPIRKEAPEITQKGVPGFS